MKTIEVNIYQRQEAPANVKNARGVARPVSRSVYDMHTGK